MDGEMRYSFIVPVYNVKQYLEKCIDSILGQSYKDHEVIIVDDGSDDGSGDILDRLYGDLQNVTIIHQENKGLGGARNTGIEQAEGEYLLFVDSDDHLDREALRVIDTYLQRYDLDILRFNMWAISETGKRYGKVLNIKNGSRLLSRSRFIIKEPTAWNKAYRASLFKQTGIRFPEHLLYEDLATIPMLALYADRIGEIDAPLYYYLQRENSIIHGTKDVKKLLQIFDGLKRIYDHYEGNGSMERFYHELEWLTIQHAIYHTGIRMMFDRYDKGLMAETHRFVQEHFPGYRNCPYRMTADEDIDMAALNRMLDERYMIVYVKYVMSVRAKKRVKEIVHRIYHV